MMHAYLVGCGGVGSYLAPVLYRELRGRADRLILIDGDRLEERNLQRQQFAEALVGLGKAEALAKQLQGDGPLVEVEEAYITPNHGFLFKRGSWIFGCVDNHPARRAILTIADQRRCVAIIAANEAYSAEAYIYFPKYQGHPTFDPRQLYPEIMRDNTGDRLGQGCQERQATGEQTATANFLAAAFAMSLFTAHYGVNLEDDYVQHLPYCLRINRFGHVERISFAG